MTPEQIALAVEAQARAYAALKHVGSNEQAAALLSPEALEALLTSQPRVWTAEESAPAGWYQLGDNDQWYSLFALSNGTGQVKDFAGDFTRAFGPHPQPPSATAGKDET